MSRVLLCDDHAVFAEALAVVLRNTGHHAVTVTRSVPEALAAAAADPPDLVVMDLGFPSGHEGLGAIRTLTTRHPHLRVLLLTGSTDHRVVAQAVEAGAEGVATKVQALDELLRAVDQVAAGEFYCAPSLVKASVRAPSAASDLAHLAATLLTPREREVLARLVQGSTTQQMADSMGVGVATVRTHVQGVLTKLGTGSRLEAVAYAIGHGIVGPPGQAVATSWS